MNPFWIAAVALSCARTGSKPPATFEAARDPAGSGLSPDQITEIADLMDEHNAPSVGIGIIRDGILAHTAYLGEQAPGVPLTSSSMFNTASVQKAVTAETVLRLVAQGRMDLDEPLSPHYVHPDLVDDPRHALLTPRIALTHRTGFRNWPYEYEDGTLSFVTDPGEAYGYSGIGVMILARAIEQKLGTPWPQIVRDVVFDPLGMTRASVVQEPWMDDHVVIPADENGQFRADFALDHGDWNSADDLFVNVEDYATFLASLLDDDAVGPALAAERVRVQSDLTENEIWGCDGVVDPCPAPFGHGIGWFVFGYDGALNIQHGGNDRTEAAMGYVDLQTGNGGVVFVNTTQGVLLWLKIVEVIDDEQKFTRVFNHVIEKFLTPEE